MENKYLKRVAIIGSTRDPCLNRNTFIFMVEKSKELIDKEYNNQKIELVSGGSAWADHVAVRLFLEEKEKYKLTLYLPCEWKDNQYFDNGLKKLEKNNPGKLENNLHKCFSKKMGYDTLREISQAIEMGANIDTSGKSFKERNILIATNCDYLIAFTRSTENFLTRGKGGGTFNTWQQCNVKKIHISLFEKLERNSPKETIQEKQPIVSPLFLSDFILFALNTK